MKELSCDNQSRDSGKKSPILENIENKKNNTFHPIINKQEFRRKLENTKMSHGGHSNEYKNLLNNNFEIKSNDKGNISLIKTIFNINEITEQGKANLKKEVVDFLSLAKENNKNYTDLLNVNKKETILNNFEKQKFECVESLWFSKIVNKGESFIFDNGGESFIYDSKVIFLDNSGELLAYSERTENKLYFDKDKLFNSVNVNLEEEGEKKITKRQFNNFGFMKEIKNSEINKEMILNIDDVNSQDIDIEKNSICFTEEEQKYRLNLIDKNYPEEIHNWFKPNAITSTIESGGCFFDIFKTTKEEYEMFHIDATKGYQSWNKYKDEFILNQDKLKKLPTTSDEWNAQKKVCKEILDRCMKDISNKTNKKSFNYELINYVDLMNPKIKETKENLLTSVTLVEIEEKFTHLNDSEKENSVIKEVYNKKREELMEKHVNAFAGLFDNLAVDSEKIEDIEGGNKELIDNVEYFNNLGKLSYKSQFQEINGKTISLINVLASDLGLELSKNGGAKDIVFDKKDLCSLIDGKILIENCLNEEYNYNEIKEKISQLFQEKENEEIQEGEISEVEEIEKDNFISKYKDFFENYKESFKGFDSIKSALLEINEEIIKGKFSKESTKVYVDILMKTEHWSNLNIEERGKILDISYENKNIVKEYKYEEEIKEGTEELNKIDINNNEELSLWKEKYGHIDQMTIIYNTKAKELEFTQIKEKTLLTLSQVNNIDDFANVYQKISPGNFKKEGLDRIAMLQDSDILEKIEELKLRFNDKSVELIGLDAKGLLKKNSSTHKTKYLDFIETVLFEKKLIDNTYVPDTSYKTSVDQKEWSRINEAKNWIKTNIDTNTNPVFLNAQLRQFRDLFFIKHDSPQDEMKDYIKKSDSPEIINSKKELEGISTMGGLKKWHENKILEDISDEDKDEINTLFKEKNNEFKINFIRKDAIKRIEKIKDMNDLVGYYFDENNQEVINDDAVLTVLNEVKSSIIKEDIELVGSSASQIIYQSKSVSDEDFLPFINKILDEKDLLGDIHEADRTSMMDTEDRWGYIMQARMLLNRLTISQDNILLTEQLKFIRDEFYIKKYSEKKEVLNKNSGEVKNVIGEFKNQYILEEKDSLGNNIYEHKGEHQEVVSEKSDFNEKGVEATYKIEDISKVKEEIFDKPVVYFDKNNGTFKKMKSEIGDNFMTIDSEIVEKEDFIKYKGNLDSFKEVISLRSGYYNELLSNPTKIDDKLLMEMVNFTKNIKSYMVREEIKAEVFNEKLAKGFTRNLINLYNERKK